MNPKPLVLTIGPAGRLGWCLRVNGEPYACGQSSYCFRVAHEVRERFNANGWAAFPDLAGSKGGAA